MPNHLSDIGFDVTSEEAFVELAIEAEQNAQEIICEIGRYLVWSLFDGPELWMQVNALDQMVGMTPAFAG